METYTPKTVIQNGGLKAPYYKIKFTGGRVGSRTYLGETYRNSELQAEVKIGDTILCGEEMSFRILDDHPDAFELLGEGSQKDLEKLHSEKKKTLEQKKAALLGKKQAEADAEPEPESEMRPIASMSGNEIRLVVEKEGIELPDGMTKVGDIEKFLKETHGITEYAI